MMLVHIAGDVPLPAVQEHSRSVPTQEQMVGMLRVAAGGMDIDPDGMDVAVVLLTARWVGHNVARLARVTGVRAPIVAKCARRLFDNGIWHEGTTVSTWRADLGTGIDQPEAFWADVGVGQGKLCRRLAEDGSPEWAAAGDWWKDYDLVRSGPEEVAATYHPRVVLTEEDVLIPLEPSAESAEQELLAPRLSLQAVTPALAANVSESSAGHVWLAEKAAGGAAGSAEEALDSSLEPAAGASELFPGAIWLG